MSLVAIIYTDIYLFPILLLNFVFEKMFVRPKVSLLSFGAKVVFLSWDFMECVQQEVAFIQEMNTQ